MLIEEAVETPPSWSALMDTLVQLPIFKRLFSHQETMGHSSKESQLTLAIQALGKDLHLSIRAAARIYSAHHTTLLRRRSGEPSRRDSLTNSQKLANLEEPSIVQYVLGLDL